MILTGDCRESMADQGPCPPGGLVGDFFAGSGAAGIAAAMCGRGYVGCELDPAMAETARRLFAEAA